MRAIRYSEYGPPDVLHLEDVDRPVPGDTEVLVRVRACSVNPVDRAFRGPSILLRLLLTGLFKPKDPRVGTDLAGVVEAAGAQVTRFRVGDQVFGVAKGALAEFTCAQQDKLARIPENVGFEEAAAVPVAGLTALQAVRDHGRVVGDARVLVNGAAGGVGTFAVQIAKAMGAHVTGVCSTRNLDLVRSLGAERAIDYTREDFTAESVRYDVIVDCVGSHGLLACRRMLTPEGRFVIVGGPKGVASALAAAIKAPLLSRLGRQRYVFFIAKVTIESLEALRGLLASGKVKPVIDSRHALGDAAEAMRVLETGHAKGKIVVRVD